MCAHTHLRANFFIQAFQAADDLREKLQYQHTLLSSDLEQNIAKFPYVVDAHKPLKDSVDTIKRARDSGRFRPTDADADLLALAERCVWRGVVWCGAYGWLASRQACKRAGVASMYV